ncbi:hypothetical protein [Olivibacter jilunii]|uniref:hypothetical protein n=1 Tax=Olivibacter jilunii TaxID=985016 RepID=UPI003F18D802
MAKFTLLTTKGQVHRTAGLNWGSNRNNHTTPYDSYIPIHLATIRANPNLVPPKGVHQQIITVTWDDDFVMQCLFEQNGCIINGVLYPKAIASTPHKRDLGIYFRNRMNLPHSHFITLLDLQNYGRTDIDFAQTGPNQYSADFHV